VIPSTVFFFLRMILAIWCLVFPNEDSTNSNEIHHICVGTRHNKTHWKLLNNSYLTSWGEKSKKVQWRGGYIYLGKMHVLV
jgi:hypothetical protein